MARTDIHRPAEFDPADYEIIDFIDNKAPDYGAAFLQGLHTGASAEAVAEMVKAMRAEYEARIFEHFPNWTTGGIDRRSIFQCNHCGAHIRWVAVALHKPTGSKLAFGDICAERCELPTRDAFRAKFIKDRAAREEAKMLKLIARATFENEAPDVVEFLAGIETQRASEFLVSVADQLTAKGTLSEAQVAAVRRFIAGQAERDARRAAEATEAAKTAQPFPVGRQTVTGTVVSTKTIDSHYGGLQLKMLVKTDDGNRIFGTAPESLQPSSDAILALKGQRVTFTADFQASKDDPHFGFYKNPRSAELVS